MIHITNVNKQFGKKVILNDITLSIPQGSLFALLGANGAGKTTLIRSILNLTQIQSGTITIDNFPHLLPISRTPICYLPEHFQFYPYYSIKQALSFLTQGASLDKKEKYEQVLQLLDLDKIQSSKLGLLSKGQVQRVGIAKAMLSSAPCLILDEPFSGLDPLAVKNLRTFLEEEHKKGRTIFINSHLISEVEKFITHFAILKKGTIITTGQSCDLNSDHRLEDIVIQSLS